MIKKTIYLLGILLFCATATQAQSWRKLRNQAEDSFEAGNYTEAAKLYEQAWRKKNKKTELIYKAGEAYDLLRDYPNAAKAFANVKDETDDFPLAGLYYARNLKQSNDYDQAIRAFNEFLDTYTGEDKSLLERIVQIEIEGTQLAKVAAANADQSVEMIHLGGGVNTAANDFAPELAPDGSLLYSSAVGGTTRIYQSELMGESWSKGELPSNFPLINNGQFANPSLSPDGQRMYFTVCEEGSFGDLKTRCEIYVITLDGVVWSQPRRLPDAINAAGVTNTHPFVTQRSNTEFLYFASNRSGNGAQGGLDIYYATRNVNLPGAAFSQPINLGAPVNTNGDEVTPYYDAEEGRLYFSSNNHPSLGGFDILVSEGNFTNWTQPVNLGMPYNSSADDYHYSEYETGGFLSSNRIFGGEKLSTLDDDIFEFIAEESKDISYQGTVIDASNGEPVNYYTVTLYEITESGQQIQVEMQAVKEGTQGFRFAVLPNRQFRIDVDVPGFLPESQGFNTFDKAGDIFAQAIIVEPENTGPPTTGGNNTTVPPDNSGNTNNSDNTTDNTNIETSTPGEPYVMTGMAPFDQAEYRTSAPKYEGTYYKVQLVAVKKFDENNPQFQQLATVGDIETEYLTERGITRVLLAAFLSPEAAKQAQAQARDMGFVNAFIVKYENGRRYGMVKLR
ncbi:MAG TPA: SPOR domain-containing protein [Saprospiraceae bacterium]|nr:SPOR domain-containing protein [Saprospiraceae bacterium]